MFKRFNSKTLRLTWFILRRERMITPIWLLSLIFITAIVPVTFSEMYSGEADRMGMAMTMQNPAMIAMCGPVYGFDDYNVGAMVANEMILFTIIAVAIMNIFLVVRHTRRDEERGRVEVIRSLPAGRLSNLSAVMLVALLVNGVLALGTGISLSALNIESMSVSGSMLYGVVLGVSGLFFAAVTALFVQLCISSRSAIGYSFVTFAVLYLIRAAGDINNETLARISPVGLILRTRVYVKNLWWPVPIVLLISIIIMGAAFYLNSIRDMDQAFIPAKPGRRRASAFLKSPLGLALRLLRPTIIAWMVGSFALGASYGSIMGDLEAFLHGNDMFMQLIPAQADYSLVERFTVMLMSVLAMGATIPVLTIILKLSGEEKRGRIENIISKSVSKLRLMAGYFGIAFVAAFIMLLLSVVGLWSAGYATMENPIAFESMFRSMMVYLPAVWFMLGTAVLLIGLFPKRTGLSWIYLGLTFFVVYLGPILKIPEEYGKLTPFGYIPQLPLDEINYGVLAGLVLITAVMTVAGFVLYRKRDVQG